MSTLHEAAQLALEALEYGQHSLKQISEYQWESRGQLAMDALKAALALDAALKTQAGCDTETDCTSQPWCRISGECHRKQAHPEPAQEPVAWMVYTEGGTSAYVTDNPNDLVGAYRALPLYTAPQPQRPPLTDEEISDIYIDWDITPGRRLADLVRAVERKVRGE